MSVARSLLAFALACSGPALGLASPDVRGQGPAPIAETDGGGAFSGLAWMDRAGKIHLSLYSYDPCVRIHAHGEFTYPEGHPQRREILAHVGDLVRGAPPVTIRPWPSSAEKPCASR